MAQFKLQRLEINFGTPAAREYPFGHLFTQLESMEEEQRTGIVEAVEFSLLEKRLPFDTDVGLSLRTFHDGENKMFRRITRRGRGTFLLWGGRGSTKDDYFTALSQSRIMNKFMINKGIDWVRLVQMSPVLLGHHIASSTPLRLGAFLDEVNRFFPDVYRVMKHNAGAVVQGDSRNQVAVLLSDAAGNSIEPNEVSGTPLAIASFSLICAITKALGRRNLFFDNIDELYGNNAREMMARVTELCIRHDLQIIGTSKPMGIRIQNESAEGIRIRQI